MSSLGMYFPSYCSAVFFCSIDSTSFNRLWYIPSWVPGAGWKKKAAKWAQEDHELFSTMREAARVRFLSCAYIERTFIQSTSFA